MCATWPDGAVAVVGWVTIGVLGLFLLGLPVALIVGRNFRRREQRGPFG